MTYGSKGKVIESATNQRFVFKNIVDSSGEFLDIILSDLDKVINENSPIGVVEFDGSGKPIEQGILFDSSNEMKELNDDIVSHFIKTSDGYEFGLTSQIDHFASALVSLSSSQKNLLIQKVTNTDDFKVYSSLKSRLMELLQLDSPDIIDSLGKDFAVAVILEDHHTSNSVINLKEGIPGVLNIDLSKLHEKLFVNAKRYTRYLNKEQLQSTACCSIVMLSCIEELSKISDSNTLLWQIENKSLLENIIVNASRKFDSVENKVPLYNNFSGNCIDYEAIFKEFNIEPDHGLINSQKLCLADIFVKKIERCTSCIKESVERIKDNSYTEEQKIILLAKIEYLRKVSNISAKHISDLNIVDILDTELYKSKESLLNRITISDKNLNTVYNSIKKEKQLLISKPLFEKYKNSFDSLFKSEIEGNDILIKK